ncbi:MAG: DUF3188 domain-containing protein [Synechococcaceae cyanobacterium]|nr:DUF3188 domain-containing protein [Synechococcaceae cyanobacterium]
MSPLAELSGAAGGTSPGGSPASGQRAVLLALSGPLLIGLALVMLLLQGRRGLQALPALLIGTGLLVHSWLSRRRRRRQLLQALRQEHWPSGPGASQG